MPALARQLPDLASEAVRVQRVLDDAWVAAVADLHRGFQATDLSTVPLARALESQVRPPRLVAGEFRLTLRGDLVRTTRHEGALEVRPLHLGYRTAFGISRKAHFQLDLELRQIPHPRPSRRLLPIVDLRPLNST